MASTVASWHIPHIPTYLRSSSDEHLYVAFLQRLPADAQEQILRHLREVDEAWANSLDVPPSAVRKLVAKPWIRDYWPSSAVILEIAKHANTATNDGVSLRSLVLVDSGWEAGNVIAARWEGEGEDVQFNAVRVPMDVANTLLTTCDANENYTMSDVLGHGIYEEAKVDFYEDLAKATPAHPVDSRKPFEWPSHLPEDLKMPKEKPYIISLRYLSESALDTLTRAISGEGKTATLRSRNIKIYNWEGAEPARRAIYHIFKQIYNNSSEADRKLHLFFVDNMLQGPDGEPQIVTAIQYRQYRGDTVKLAPIPTASALALWKASASGGDEEELLENYTDIWRKEDVHDIENGLINFDQVESLPVFFLRPFSADEERKVRTALSSLSYVEEGEDWGNDFTYFGYLWPDSTSIRSIQDLGALFESCEPWNPSYDPKSPGPYSFANYPRHFVVVDDRCLDLEDPKVIMASTLDFHGDDTSDDLGWIYGTLSACEAHINFVNFVIANMGPEESFDEPDKLWLSDLKEYSANEWRAAQEEDGEDVDHDEHGADDGHEGENEG